MRSALRCIEGEQRRGGGFITLSSSDPEDFSSAQSECTIFTVAVILSSLNVAAGVFQNAVLEKIRRRAARFIRRERNTDWSFNYWAHRSKERGHMPYPDDWDDTAVALAALGGYENRFITFTVLRAVSRLMAMTAVKPGGPYRTWLLRERPPAHWRDVDVAVNSNIGNLLSFLGIGSARLQRWLRHRIEHGEFISRYYPAGNAAFYFAARFLGGRGAGIHLAASVLARRKPGGGWGNPLQTALGIAALLAIGRGDALRKDDIESLLRTVRREGWRAYGFCLDPAREGQQHYAGAPALTAAVSLEALALYERFLRGQGRTPGAWLEDIKKIARSGCSSLPTSLRSAAWRAIDRIYDPEITFVPWRMKLALGATISTGPTVPGLIERLSLGNLYGWIAYGIYDHCRDGEGATAGMLPVANHFLRELTAIYTRLEHDLPGMGGEFFQLMRRVDGADFAEATGVTPRIHRLAERSIAHALPALGVLSAAGTSPKSPDGMKIKKFFREYLIARQLHDDARDWKVDLARGRVNSVASFLKKSGISSRSASPLLSRKEIVQVVSEIKRATERARNALRGVRCVQCPAPLLDLLRPLEIAAERVLLANGSAPNYDRSISDTRLRSASRSRRWRRSHRSLKGSARRARSA